MPAICRFVLSFATGDILIFAVVVRVGVVSPNDDTPLKQETVHTCSSRKAVDEKRKKLHITCRCKDRGMYGLWYSIMEF